MARKNHSKLWLYFTGVVLATVLLVFLIVLAVWLALYQGGLVAIDPRDRHIPAALFLLGSVLLGVVLALFAGRLIIRPVQRMSDAFAQLSQGCFDVQVPTQTPLAEIREMSERFNAMTYDLAHMETLRSDFVANVSHEFKTPLAAIEGYATLLQNPKLSPEKRTRYTEIILDNTRRLSSLTSSILALSKLENQELIVDNRSFRLDEQLRKAVLSLESRWSAKKLEFDMDLPVQMYYGSEALLWQVWVNLLDNAVKHSPQGGIIQIQLLPANRALTVCVTDRGSGMSEEVQKHIFEKFYQGDGSRTSEGCGLGLALVKRIVDLCQGQITVRSAPGKGAAFSVTLPLRTV